MDRWLAVAVMAVAGGLVALQPAMNSGIAKSVGGLPAAMVSFGIGTLALAVVVVLTGQAFQLGSLGGVPSHYLLGGAFGALWVAFSIPAVNAIGAGGVFAATIAGQLTGAVIADHLGILGLAQVGVTVPRLIGIALLGIGTYLIVR